MSQEFTHPSSIDFLRLPPKSGMAVKGLSKDDGEDEERRIVQNVKHSRLIFVPTYFFYAFCLSPLIAADYFTSTASVSAAHPAAQAHLETHNEKRRPRRNFQMLLKHTQHWLGSLRRNMEMHKFRDADKEHGKKSNRFMLFHVSRSPSSSSNNGRG